MDCQVAYIHELCLFRPLMDRAELLASPLHGAVILLMLYIISRQCL